MKTTPPFEQLTLDNVISRRRCLADGWQDWPGELTEEQRAGLLALFGQGCRQSTKKRLADCFADNCRRVKNCGIMRRVHLADGFDGVSYCAGQDYPSEVTFIRKILIASY